jgi:hypothetical protein
MGALRTITVYLRELGIDEHDFFRDVPDQFKRIETMITEELVKPTASLSDLMYKSVDIRDSRFSLQLGTSMWRLSWVTFAFLPLTFLTGFFGMNVTTFQNSAGYPSIWWSVYPHDQLHPLTKSRYFVVAVPLMLLIFLSYYMIKKMITRREQDRFTLDTSDAAYTSLAPSRRTTWSRPSGPASRVAQAFSRLLHFGTPRGNPVDMEMGLRPGSSPAASSRRSATHPRPAEALARLAALGAAADGRGPLGAALRWPWVGCWRCRRLAGSCSLRQILDGNRFAKVVL